MMRSSWVFVIAITAALSACNDAGVGGPGKLATGSLTFVANGASRSISGDPASDGTILSQQFAVALADSVGGLVLIGYEPTGDDHGNLLVLQAPREPSSYACLDSFGTCHGRHLTGFRDSDVHIFDTYYAAVDGSLTLTQIGPDRVRGTFELTLVDVYATGTDTIFVRSGTIDVPYVTNDEVDFSIKCLLRSAGVGNGACYRTM